MRERPTLACHQGGAAAAEMALALPLLLTLLFGSIEVGNYFYNEHKLLKGVRDGARYAARQRFSNFTACSGTPTGTVFADTKLIVQKGTLDATAQDLLPNWGGASFNVTTSCTASLTDATGGTLSHGGIYANATTGAPTVLVSASLPYRPLFVMAFGVQDDSLSLNATQSAAVAGL